MHSPASSPLLPSSMEAPVESSVAPATPSQAHLHFSRPSDRVPTFAPAPAGNEASIQEGQTGTSSGYILSLHFTLHAFWEVLGYVPRRDLPLESWALGRFVFSWMLALPQILAIIIVIALASGHPSPRYGPHSPGAHPPQTGRGNCSSMSPLNIFWLAKLMLQCYVDGWFLLHRWKTGREPIQGPPVICPPDHTALVSVLSFIDVACVSIWIFVECFAIGEDGPRCLAGEPRIFVVGIVVFVLAVMYYFPTSLMYCIRRSREPRPGFPDDNVEMVGPISQKTAARLALRFYIPQPELSSAPSRPVGPAAFLRPIGRRELDNWDQKFRSMEHPFLRLPKAEAKCLFCLDDYVELPRVLPVAVEGSSSQLDHAETQGIPVPLRLLACGHHFHKECLDRYITQVSARCPVCRARVQAPPLPGSR